MPKDGSDIVCLDYSDLQNALIAVLRFMKGKTSTWFDAKGPGKSAKKLETSAQET
jgi:hypothetical protein